MYEKFNIVLLLELNDDLGTLQTFHFHIFYNIQWYPIKYIGTIFIWLVLQVIKLIPIMTFSIFWRQYHQFDNYYNSIWNIIIFIITMMNSLYHNLWKWYVPNLLWYFQKNTIYYNNIFFCQVKTNIIISRILLSVGSFVETYIFPTQWPSYWYATLYPYIIL